MQSLDDHEVPRSRNRLRGPMALILAVFLAWAAVATVHLFGVWLRSHVGPLVWGVYAVAWLVAATATVLGAVALILTRRRVWAAMALVVGALAATTIAAVDWTYAFVHSYYRVNRADFAAVAELSRAGRLGENGGRLPAELRHLAINGDPITYGAEFPDSTAVWLPAWTGMVDGMTGYAYIGDPPAGTTVDCLFDPCLVRWSLGDGWSWVDMDVAPPDVTP